VCPSTTTSSAFKEQQHQPSTSSPPLADDDSSSAPTALFETKVQRFTCHRENMQQYWIPEGYHPVLIPRAYLADSLVATSNNSGHLMNTVNAGNVIIHQLRPRINNDINDIELRRRRNLNNNDNKISTNNNNGGISKKRRRNNINNVNVNRRPVLGQSSPTVNINTVIHRQRLKERISAMRNSAVTISPISSLKNNNNNNNPSDRSPSIIIGEMWKEEPENIKKHYERLAIRKKIAQALAFEQKFSSPSSGKSISNHVHVRSNTTTTSNSRHNHVNPSICPTTGSSYRFAVHSNAVEGVAINGSSFDNYVRQNVDNSTPFPPSSSPIISNDSSRHVPDWMTRSDDDDESDVEYDADNNSTITTIV